MMPDDDGETLQNLSYKARAERTIERIAGFYGFDDFLGKVKTKAEKTAARAEHDTSPIVTPEEYEQRRNSTSALREQSDDFPASQVDLSEVSATNNDLRPQTPYQAGSGSTSSGSYIPVVYAKPNPNPSGIEPKAVTLNGQKYDVFESFGKKYAKIPGQGSEELESIIARGGIYSTKTAAPQEPVKISPAEYEQRRQTSVGQKINTNSAGSLGGFSNSKTNTSLGSVRGGGSDFTASLSRAAAAMQGLGGETKVNLARANSSGPTYGGQGGVMIETPKEPVTPKALPKESSPLAGNQEYLKASYYDAPTITVEDPDDPEAPVLQFRLPLVTETKAIQNVEIGKARDSDNNFVVSTENEEGVFKRI